MSIISSIRERSGRMALKKEASRNPRKRKVINLADAGRVGILYYLDDETIYPKVSAYVKKLQDAGKQVKALGYVEDKRLTVQLLPKLSFDFLYPSGLSWNYRTVSTHARDFIDEEYDILIDLGMEDHFPLIYITGASKAMFKVGMKSDKRSPYLDLMIELKEKDGLDDLIKQVDHYVSIINKRNES